LTAEGEERSSSHLAPPVKIGCAQLYPVSATDFPAAASHPFYTRLNQLLREHGFDDFAEAQCARFYADTMGGYHSRATVRDLETLAIRTYISEPDRGRQSWTNQEPESMQIGDGSAALGESDSSANAGNCWNGRALI